MFRTAYKLGGILVLAGAVVLVTPELGQAQHRGGGGAYFARGNFNSGHVMGGYYGGFNNGRYFGGSHYNYPRYGYRSSFRPSLGYPNYGGFGNFPYSNNMYPFMTPYRLYR